MSKKIVNDNLRKVIQLSYEMLELADHGDRFREDSGCGVVYGALRDEAYKIRQIAEDELLQHGSKPKASSLKNKKKILQSNKSSLFPQNTIENKP